MMVLLGAGVVGGLVAATQSDGGREWIRGRVAGLASRGLHGRLHIGRLSGVSSPTSPSTPSNCATPTIRVHRQRPLSLRYDPRDLLDGRFVIRAVDVRNPLMIVRRELDGQWNFRKIFPVEDETTKPVIPRPRGTFGAYVLLHNIRIQGGEVRLTKPWHPDDSLKGARRDSAIVTNLADKTHDIRRVALRGRQGFQTTWRWSDIGGVITRLRFGIPTAPGASSTSRR